MKITKKLLLPILALVLSFSFGNIVKAEAPAELIKAIEKTFNSNFEAVYDGTVEYGQSSLDISGKLTQNNNRLKEQDTFKLKIDIQDFDEEAPAFVLTSDINLEAIMDITEKQQFFEINRLNVKVDSEEKALKEGIEGFAEMFKHIVNKTYEIDMNKIEKKIKSAVKNNSTFSDSDLKEFGNISSLFVDYDKIKKNIGKLYEVIFNSGVLKVTKNLNTYTITFAEEPEITNIKEIMEVVLNIFPFPPQVREEVAEEIEKMTQEDIDQVQMESRFALGMLKEFLDLKIIMKVQNQKLQSIKETISFMPAENLGIPIKHSINIETNSKFTYRSTAIKLPKTDADTISLTKFITGMIAIGEYTQKQMGDSEKNWKKVNAATVEKQRDFMKNNSAHQWYEEYIYHVEQTLYIFLDAASSVDNETLYKTLAELIRYTNEDAGDTYYGGYVCDPSNPSFDSDVSFVQAYIHQGVQDGCMDIKPEKIVQRQDGLKLILKTLYPDTKKLNAFAEANKIVSKKYLRGRNRFKKMQHAELAKIVSKILDINSK